MQVTRNYYDWMKRKKPDYFSDLINTIFKQKSLKEDMDASIGNELKSKILEELAQHIKTKNLFHLGYPNNTNQWWSNELQWAITNFHLNVGDPFQQNRLGTAFMKQEQEIIQFFAKLLNLDDKDTWGYTTSGSSSAILQGLYHGRQYLSQFQQNNNLVVIHSKQAHYSVLQACDLLSLQPYYTTQYWKEITQTTKFNSCDKGVPVTKDYAIDIVALEQIVEHFAQKQHSLLIILASGTTIGHGCDPIKKCYSIIERLCKKYDCKFWIHLDAALHGAILPFLNLEQEEQTPQITFECINSCNISTHKWFGLPWPCGIYLTKKDCFKRPHKEFAEYAKDWELAPIGCSRNSVSVIVLWHFIQSHDWETLREFVIRERRLMQNTLTKMQEDPLISRYCQPRIPSPYAFTIMLKVPKPNRDRYLHDKYTLPELNDGYTQIQFMPHVNEALTEEFIKDLRHMIQEEEEQNSVNTDEVNTAFAMNKPIKEQTKVEEQIETQVVHTDGDPLSIIALAVAFTESRILFTAQKVGLFDTLHKEGPMTTEQIKAIFGFSGIQLNDFLDYLVAKGLLNRSGTKTFQTYSNSQLSEEYLVKGKQRYMGHAITLADAGTESRSELVERLKHGRPAAITGQAEFEEMFKDKERAKEYLLAMAGFQMVHFEEFVKRFDFSKYSKVADIGGGLGVLACLIAQTCKDIKVATLDLEVVQPLAKEYLSQWGVLDRVEVGTIDFHLEEFPPSDVVIMGNILHDWNLEDKKKLIKKAFNALPQNGVFVAIENMLDTERKENSTVFIWSLAMLRETQEGFYCSEGEFEEWCLESGFRRVEFMSLRGASKAGIAYK